MSTSTIYSKIVIRNRFIILFYTLLSLAIASLNSANARFAFILRHRARSDNGILDNTFQSLQNKIIFDAVITAVATAALAVYGAVIVVHPRWLRERESILQVFAIFQVIVAFTMVVTGSYLADNVNGFRTSFETFGTNDSIPYYSMMYYGGIAQATYGSVLVFLAIIVVILVYVRQRQGGGIFYVVQIVV